MAHANLPVMPGKPPLGGPILSQDIVEAALLGRAGWAVEWDVESGGSYDELPPNILAYGKRDRRWCQGNFQHFWLIFGDRMTFGHRLYFANGIFAYLTGPLLLLLLAMGVIRSAGPGAVWLDWKFLGLLGTIIMLPRVLGFANWMRTGGREAANCLQPRGRMPCFFREITSMVLELVMTLLTSPLLFYLHTRFVLEILTGRMVTWGTQTRDAGEGITWRAAAAWFWMPTVLALILLYIGFAFSLAAMIYMLPIIAGWLISIPLAVVISHPGVGRFFIAMGMFEGAGDEIRGRVAERDAQGMKASKASIRPKVEAGISG